VLKPGLVSYSIYNTYWFWGRPSSVDLWHDLRAVMRDTRPDWDLRTPGLREAWDAGDMSPFHGWDKRAATTDRAETQNGAGGDQAGGAWGQRAGGRGGAEQRQTAEEQAARAEPVGEVARAEHRCGGRQTRDLTPGVVRA
jgi:hypothetical protein